MYFQLHSILKKKLMESVSFIFFFVQSYVANLDGFEIKNTFRDLVAFYNLVEQRGQFYQIGCTYILCICTYFFLFQSLCNGKRSKVEQQIANRAHNSSWGPFNNYVEKMRGERLKKCVFVHARGIKTVHAGEGGFKKWQNSVHVVVEWPLVQFGCWYSYTLLYVYQSP